MIRRFMILKALLIAVGLSTVLCGCSYLLPLAFVATPKQKVAPEYDKLANTRILVLVWADPATLFDYPYVRLELASYVRDKLAAELSNIELVDPVRVADYQQRTLDGSLDPERVGREFDANTVVYLELLQFQIRDSSAPDFLRAQIEASVAVYDLDADPDEPKIYHLKPVEVLYPEQGGVLFSTSNSAQVRQAGYALFAEKVARKFYEYEEEL
ncbi:MAG: hypothetical protein KAV82_14520 [Phycisphaerae bacterium]|nr:hypothetical protein [Phycisphaerae bacterium]